METIIGLGAAGCNIAKAFSKYPQYSIYMIDSEPHDGTSSFLMEACSSHEEYEKKCPSFAKFFSQVSGDCLFVLGGGGAISGASLATLQQLKKYANSDSISILYVHPEQEELQGLTALQHNIVFGILQEYARSGLLEKMYVVQNCFLEEVLQEIPVIGYHEKLNELIVSSFHMINVFNNSKSEFDTFKKIADPARIATFGVFDIEKNEEKSFFNLTMPREKCYYFAINREKLKTDGTILKGIKDTIKKRMDGKTRITYGIYSTKYEDAYAYCVHHSSLVEKTSST